MTTDEFVKKYRGAIPDSHNRTPWKTWDGIELDMKADLKRVVENILTQMTTDERLDIFGDYCKCCGTDDPYCQCMNDE